MAAEILQRVSQDERERAKYDSRLRWILDKNTVLNEAERIKKQAAEIEERAAETEKKAAEIRKQAEEDIKQAEETQKQAEEMIARTVKGLANSFSIVDISKMLGLSEDSVSEIIEKK